MSAESRASPSELRRLIEETYKLDEIRMLCFDLGIDYEELPGEKKSTKTAELVLYCQRRGQLPDLIQELRRQRPHVAWPDASAFPNEQMQDPGTIRGLWEQNLRGIERLPVDYAGGIRNFLAEYTGVAGEKVPFGGRDAEMAELDTWLLDDHSPSCALMVAEAGRGKSALLVRWTASVTARKLGQVAFIPISIRFETASQSAVFGALAARLSELHGEPIAGKQLAMTAEEYRLVCRSLLEKPLPEGERLLLVLDGLDEASDWQPGANLVPLPLPAGVRVLVSARLAGGAADAGGWLRPLNWARLGRAQTFHLQPLSQAGVADVLAEMGNPLAALSDQIDVVGELYRLSDEGDPLLVKLYVEKLTGLARAEPTITPEKLQAIKPGLEAYMEDWWRDQRQLWQVRGQRPLPEKHVTTVLNLLALALGPLSQDDLLALAPPDAQLDSYTLEDALDPLQRFVIGDGRKVHFVFSHPRLRDYFFDRLPAAEKQHWQARFLAYGQNTLEDLAAGRTQPEAVAYVIRHYGAHLDHAQAAPETFYQLLSQSWAEAWYTLEGTYAGFLNDVARIRVVAAAEKNIPVVVHCALCRASVVALSSNISPTLMAQAIELNLLTARQALVLIRQMPNSEQQAEALRTIAPLLKTDDLRRAALSTARQIRDEEHRAQALTGLAPHLPESLGMEAVTEVLSVARQIRSEWPRAQVLAGLVPYLPEALRTEAITEALSAARQVWDEEYRAQALAGLVPYLPEALRAEVITEALNAARQIREEWSRPKALAELAPHLPDALWLEVVIEALNAARQIREEWSRPKALAELVPHLPDVLRLETVTEALSAAHQIADEEYRAQALAGLVPHLPQALLPEVLSVTNQIDDEWSRAQVLAELAPHLPQALLSEALSAAHQIGDEWSRAHVLTALASHLPEALRSAVVTEALGAARQIGDEWSRAQILAVLAPHLPEALRTVAVTETFSAARQIGDEWSRARVLTTLVPHLPEALRTEAITEALSAARQIGDGFSRAQTLAGLVPHLPEALRTVTITEALSATRQIRDEGPRAQTLAELTPYLPQALLSEALSATRQIGDEWSRAHVLAALVSHLPQAVLPEVLIAAHQLGDEWPRAHVLAALVSHLPQAVLPEVLTTARQTGHEWPRAQVLAALAPHLPEALRVEVLTAARQTEHEWPRTQVLAALAPYLPEALRTEALTESFSSGLQIGNEEYRAQVLTGLAPHLPQASRMEAVTEAFSAAHQIGDEWSRARALASLAPYLAGWARAQLEVAYGSWLESLDHLSTHPRPAFLADMRVLLPYTLALADETSQPATAVGIWRAIQAVCQWWP